MSAMQGKFALSAKANSSYGNLKIVMSFTFACTKRLFAFIFNLKSFVAGPVDPVRKPRSGFPQANRLAGNNFPLPV